MKIYFWTALFITLFIHTSLWLKLEVPKFNNEIIKPKRIVLNSIRTVGKENGKSKSIKLQDRKIKKNKADSINKDQNKKKISLSDLATNHFLGPTSILRQKNTGIKNLALNKNSMRNFTKNSIASDTTKQLLKDLGESDINIKFDVPKGVKIDELNKAELKLYSFQRRTAINYINTFYKELRDFQQKNPHLKFPIVNSDEKMTGRITYDLNGDIVRIKMVRWSEEGKLQSFFENLMKELNKLPNPPKELVQNGEFNIYYTLDIKI